MTETALAADVVLPTLSYVEKEGHFINIEGRVQKINPGKELPKTVYSDQEIFTLLALRFGKALTIDKEFQKALHEEARIENSILIKTPSKVEATLKEASGLRATFAKSLFDHGVRMRHNPHLLEMVKDPLVRIHPEEAVKHQLADGHQARITAEAGAVIGTISYDASVAKGTVVLPLGFSELAVFDLAKTLFNGLHVKAERFNE
jgi:NADH-quinone oxidoreductase subunit G